MLPAQPTRPAPTALAERAPPSAWLAFVLSVPLALPILAIAALALRAEADQWPRLIATVLPSMAWQTFVLCAGTAAATLAIGTIMAFLVTMYSFPARNFLKWMALLPLAMPGYIVSFVYVDFLSFPGAAQTWLRGLAGWTSPSDYMFPEIRSLGGAVTVLALVLYPYVYMSARAAFLKQPMGQIDVARTLGRSPWRAFIEITLPQARPALAVGVSLVVMECLNDIGAVGFFGVTTLSYGIYSTWLGQGDLGAAAQLAFIMLFGVAALILFEQFARDNDRLSRATRAAPVTRQRLTGAAAWAAVAAMLIPVFFGFLLPAGLLLGDAARRWENLISEKVAVAAANSIVLAALACAGTLVIALALAYANRQYSSRALAALTRFSSLGYALPGTVLGIGIMVPFGLFDNWFDGVARASLGVSPGLLLSGTIAALVFAYITRFLVIALGTVEAGLGKISPHLDQAARTLGRSPFTSFREIHLPLLRPSLITAALLVFVDAMKELPATLILRPFDFETLATHVFTLSSLGLLEDSAVPALAIVAAGLIPVVVLSRNLSGPARGN